LTTATDLKPGTSYRVNSSRKGVFTGRLVRADATWATFVVEMGKAGAMLAYNERHPGEEVTVRREWCTFEEVDAVTAHYLDRAAGAHAAKAP
jgi:hypothetical protein